MTKLVGKDPEYLSTLERGLSVLRAFDDQHPEMRLSEVAIRTGLSPAVARRCLNTLVALGYVGVNGRNFLLRPEVLAFGSAFLASMNIEQACVPSLQILRDETGDSASMSVLSGRQILYIAHVSTNRHIRLGANVGTRFPLHATSMGKAMIAFQPAEEVDAFLSAGPLESHTNKTVTSADVFRARLAQVRAQGFDSALDELDYGIVSVAVPLFDAKRKVVAAINCSTTTSRISQADMINTRLPVLRRAAQEIEDALRRWPALLHMLST
ncbi:MAG: IclR family transcriptional regulator C-terminal domain-containing protein [Sphingomonadaceae bacterium]